MAYAYRSCRPPTCVCPLPFPAGIFRAGEAEAVYRPRHPEASSFYRLFEQYFDEYVYAYEERFEPRSGPLRAVVRRSVEGFSSCGRLEGGFARLRCGSCGGEHLLAFSCQTRNFCPSCQAKRSALFAERLVEELLEPVAHRHFVLTLPRAIRGLFERDRSLLSVLSQTGYEAILRCLQAVFERTDVRPGVVTSIQTFGSFAANFHPHLHMLVTEGCFTAQGQFLPLFSLDTTSIEELFRRLLLSRLHQAERLSEGFMRRLLSWSPSGFSVFARQLIRPDEREQLERMARYLTRAPLSLSSVHLDDVGQVEVTTAPDPHTGETLKRLDPLECIHAITSQIPDPGSHLTRAYGFYSNRARGARLGRPAEPARARR